jgi:hypothetical protein
MAQKLAISLALVALSATGGCGSGKLPVAPAKGQVFYQGKPLEFGSVMFQPSAGPPARGIIQPDGSFQLSTYGANDGAIIGLHQVRVACFESQRPAGSAPPAGKGEAGVGRSLIPAKYSNLDTSELLVEVKAANEPFVLNLAD